MLKAIYQAPLKFLAWVGVSLMMAGILGLIAAMVIFNHYSKGLPSFESLAEYSPPVLTRLYAGNGKLLAEYATEKRIFVPLTAIPKTVQQAFISAEDQNFYDHKGIDILGIARAIKDNIENVGSGRSMVGGSTITQQVVKNFLLTNEKSFERKIKEAILAYRISQVYSKDKILELYLNEIYLGNGSYGVAAAALNYFNKPLNEISVEEAAMLAAMPKAPSSYDPRFNYNGALERRNYVLSRLYEDGVINRNEWQRASAMPIELVARDKDEIVKADFFAEEVRRKLAKMYGSQVLYEGGLVVKTTIDEDLQTIADNALRQALVNYDRRFGWRGALANSKAVAAWQDSLVTYAKELNVPLFEGQSLAMVLQVVADKAIIGLGNGEKGQIPLSELTWARKDLPGQQVGAGIRAATDVLKVGDIIIAEAKKDNKEIFGLHQIPEVNGGLVAMDVHTGRVLAMSGGYSYQNTEFNRVTQAKRQPGSAFKPIAYLAALENGFTPSTIILDSPIEISQGPGLPMWRPKNYEGKYMGATTMRVGLEKSRNTMTVRLAQMLGIARIINMAKRLGVYKGNVPLNYSVVLGAHETTLMRMAAAYATFANGGYHVKTSLIERIDDRDGNIIFRRDDRPCVGCEVDMSKLSVSATPPLLDDAREVLVDPRVAYQITSILNGATIRGTAASARVLGRPVAGKTGTTNESRDAWFVGYSPDLVVATYIGYDQPKSLGAKETGGRVALPAFIGFMKEALKDQPIKPFRIPQGIQMVQVDLQTGLPPYPGMMPSGKIIAEAFITGGNIYKPALPEDAVQEAAIGAEAEDPNSVMQGYDPNSEWQDVDTGPMIDGYPSANQPARPVPPRVQQPVYPSALYPGRRLHPNIQEGFNPYADPVAPIQPQAPAQNPPPRPAQDVYDPPVTAPTQDNNSVNYGTGGIY